MGRGRAERLSDEPLTVKEGSVMAVAFSPDGKTIAAAYTNNVAVGGVILWDVAARAPARRTPHRGGGQSHGRGLQPERQDHRGRVHSRLLPRWCGAVGRGPRQRLADQPLSEKEGPVRSVVFSPDGKTIAAAYGVFAPVFFRPGGMVLLDVASRSRLSTNSSP